MVMPCSRSASRPSTSSAKSILSPSVPNFLLSFSSEASVSSNSSLVSYSSRPIRVDLPSSTLPQVRKRSRLFFSWSARNFFRSVWAFMSVHQGGLAQRGGIGEQRDAVDGLEGGNRQRSGAGDPAGQRGALGLARYDHHHFAGILQHRQGQRDARMILA